jgi:hypothetical protein
MHLGDNTPNFDDYSECTSVIQNDTLEFVGPTSPLGIYFSNAKGLVIKNITVVNAGTGSPTFLNDDNEDLYYALNSISRVTGTGIVTAVTPVISPVSNVGGPFNMGGNYVGNPVVVYAGSGSDFNGTFTIATVSTDGTTLTWTQSGATETLATCSGCTVHTFPSSINLTVQNNPTVASVLSSPQINVCGVGGTRPCTAASLGSGTPIASATLCNTGTGGGNGNITSSCGTSPPVVPTGKIPQTANVSLTFTIAPALTPVVINPATPPAGQVGTAYSFALTAMGGTAPYIWTLASGALPPGITLSAAGMLAGTPTTAGSYTAGILLTDSSVAAKLKATKSERIQVAQRRREVTQGVQ